jgi:hypothetical protein
MVVNECGGWGDGRGFGESIASSHLNIGFPGCDTSANYVRQFPSQEKMVHVHFILKHGTVHPSPGNNFNMWRFLFALVDASAAGTAAVIYTVFAHSFLPLGLFGFGRGGGGGGGY